MTDAAIERCRDCGTWIHLVVAGYSGFCYRCVQARKGGKR